MEKIIGKIRKLLALGGNAGATEAEAALAMERANALLAQHNLSVAEVGEEPTDDISHTAAGTTDRKWEGALWDAAAQLNFTDYFYVKTNRGLFRHYVVGRPINIEATRLMAEYLATTVQRLGRDAAKAFPTKERRVYRLSFRVGCSDRIGSRARLIRREREKEETSTNVEGGTINLPALASLYKQEHSAIEAFYKAMGIILESGRSRRSVGNVRAYVDGVAAGNDVSFNKQVGG